mmetsp:Transcript_2256/g.6573  ORF Transcript_2256/g.6573 Transcript_2256/m.6573 type:complete len:82 (+) Transcript_2256:1434-1679(+)
MLFWSEFLLEDEEALDEGNVLLDVLLDRDSEALSASARPRLPAPTLNQGVLLLMDQMLVAALAFAVGATNNELIQRPISTT